MLPPPAVEEQTCATSQSLAQGTDLELELECQQRDSETSGAGIGDDDCVVTKVTRVDDPIMSIEVPSDEDSAGGSAPAATLAPAAPVPVRPDSSDSDSESDKSEILLSSQALASVPQVITGLPV
jgi:hypothetical protein